MDEKNNTERIIHDNGKFAMMEVVPLDLTPAEPSENEEPADTAVPAITPEQAAALKETLNKIAEVFTQIWEGIAATFNKISEGIANLHKYSDAHLHTVCDNPKHWHLYKHAKKLRTRKKYRNKLKRLVDEFYSDHT